MQYTSREVYEFISIQQNDPIVQWKICAVSGVEFPIYESDMQFYKKISSVRGGDDCLIPTPTLCPEERCRRRLGWQNMRNLYHRVCDATGMTVITNISPDKKMTVYTQKYWWSDARDFKDYGRDIDFDRPFFEQFAELMEVVPQPNLMANYLLDENSEYTNYAGNNKDCYLVFHADMNRDCYFGVGIKKCNNTVDCVHTHGCDVMYECSDARNCHNCKYISNSEDCANSWFLKSCFNCKDCIWCVNMTNEQYCIFNTKYSRDEYLEKKSEYKLDTHDGIQSFWWLFEDHLRNFPRVAMEQYQCSDCVGDQIFRSERVVLSTDIQESRDVKYCNRIYNGLNDDVYDVNEYGMQISKIYEWLAIGISAQNVIAGLYVNEEVNRIGYSMHVHHSSNMFWCISANNAEYCILNKQYSKEEYEILVLKLIKHMKSTGEWWEFFPLAISPFGYDETVAQEYYPLFKRDAEAMWSKFTEYVKPEHIIPDALKWSELPQTIEEVDDTILQKIIHCSISGKPYRIIKKELEFYRTNHLPLPRIHPDERHLQRWKRRNPRWLYLRECSKTGDRVISNYPVSYHSPIWSQEVYNQEIYG